MKILLFDMMGTLVLDPYPASFEWLLKKRGLDFATFQRARNRRAYLDFESGFIGEYEFFRAYYRDDLSSELQERLPKPQKIKKEMYKCVSLLPGAEGLLQDLLQKKEGLPLGTEGVRHEKPSFGDFRVGLASNYSVWYHTFLQRLPILQEVSDYLFFSCEMGYRKPDRRYYERIEESLPFSEMTFFFADDRPENLAVPRELGWHVHHMQSISKLKEAWELFLKSPRAS